jgi:hypothetical protein
MNSNIISSEVNTHLNDRPVPQASLTELRLLRSLSSSIQSTLGNVQLHTTSVTQTLLTRMNANILTYGGLNRRAALTRTFRPL